MKPEKNKELGGGLPGQGWARVTEKWENITERTTKKHFVQNAIMVYNILHRKLNIYVEHFLRHFPHSFPYY